MDDGSPASERAAKEYLTTVWNDRRYSSIPSQVTESFVMYDPTAPGDPIPGPKGEVHGPEGLAAFVRGVARGFPDFHVDVNELLADGDLAMYEGRLTMTHEGSFFGIPPTNGHVDVRYMGVIRMMEGRVDEHRVYPPMLEIARQLGFTSPRIIPYLPRLAWALLTRTV